MDAHVKDVGETGDVHRNTPRQHVAGGAGVNHVVAAEVVVLGLVPGAAGVMHDLSALHAARILEFPGVVLR